jgi:hypothetical protein
MLMKYKDNISITIDREVKTWLIDWCTEKGTTLSEGTNLILKNAMKSLEPTIIKCKCGCEYSSKLKECPACKVTP